MTPFKIYQKTMVFNWFKLGLGLLPLLICAIILGGTWFVINNFELDLTTTIGASCGAFLVAVAIYYIIMCKQGYSIKIGHLEVIEYALKNDAVPPNQLEYSKKVVTERFGSNGKYYMFSRSLTVATSQISRVISRGFSLESEAPNLKTSSKIIRIISLPALNLMDECCMAYALRNKDYEVNAACVDALTILTQNWPRFIRNALFTSIRIYLFILIVATVFFIPGYAVSATLHVSCLPWLGLSFIIALIFKIAFLDSYVLSTMICDFLNIAGSTTIDPKNYAKLDHWSKAYAQFRKAAEKAAEKAEDAAEKAERAAKKAAKKEKKREDEEAPKAEESQTQDINTQDSQDSQDKPSA